jgi:hypothetical protein
MVRPKLLCVLAGIFFCIASYGQSADSLADKALAMPGRLFSRLQARTTSLDRQLTRQTEKYLKRMARQEAQLQKQLSGVDSAAVQRLFAGSADRYAALARKMATDSGGNTGHLSGEYLPYVDSLKGSLSFLQQNPQLLGGAGNTHLSPQAQAQLARLQSSVAGFTQLQAKLQDADEVKEFIRQRKEQIKQYLSTYTHLPAALGKEYQGLNQQVYYYSQQVREYRQLLNDPDRLEKQALSLLGRLPAFQQFMKSNGQLAGLFSVPSGYGSPSALAGLQTQDQVNGQIQSQLGTGGPGATSALQQNLQSADQQLGQFKDKLGALGGGSGDIEMPNFKPNGQKTRTFWRRLEYGSNLQTTRTNYYFPTTTDIGLSLGYRLNDKNTLGVGASYKIGWGNGINHIALSSQGVGLRSFIDIRIKGTFSATGGLEYNYTTPFTNFQQLRQIEWWTRSGLIGVSKTVSVKNRVFKKTSLQLLWDFLSYQQVPKTQPILFRIGYGFN